MSIVLLAQTRDLKPVREAFLKRDPNLDVEIWPDVRDKQRVQFAVAWKHPVGVFSNFPNLRAVSSLGAGVDHLMDDESIPESMPITRVVAPSLTGDMSDYVKTAVLNYLRSTHLFYRQQQRAEWNMVLAKDKKKHSVGIMGLGELGSQCAKDLVALGCKVNGWSRSRKEIEGVTSYTEKELDQFLTATNIVVCLLPLTSKTADILNLELFKKLKRPAHIISVGRGEHLVEEDLVYALDAGIIHSATLDVFRQEPLPANHTFWNRKELVITPHIASVSDPDEAAEILLENYKRLMSGQPLLHRVDRKQEY
ncbi:MAG: 2-hydroxyacid dehydrogenase [Balneolaceae bacterium]